MTRKPDDWMPLHIGDYLANTSRLTRSQHGAYLLLLMAYWTNGGPLDDDDIELAAITKSSNAEWKKLRTVLAKFFSIKDGKWIQGRAEEELKIAKQKMELKAKAGKTGAQARWQKHNSANATAMATALPTQSEPNAPLPLPLPLPTSVEDKSSTGADAPVVVEFPKPEKQKLDPDGNPSWWPKRDKNRNIQKNVDSTLVYDFGKSVLGKSAGGVITELLKFYEYDYRSVADILLQAHEQPNPMGWVKGNVLKRLPHERVLAHHVKYDENEYRNAL